MKTSHALMLVALILTVLAWRMPAMAADAETPDITLQSGRATNQTDHVVVRLEVGGETKFSEAGKPQREKVSVLCDLDYFEKTLDAAADANPASRSVRDYRKVSVEVKVGDGQFKPALLPEHRLIVAEADGPTTLLFSPGGSLTRDELDAIDIQANSLLLERLLPERPVAVGDCWEHPAELLAAMLGLDEVGKTTVQSTLKEVADTVVRFELTGKIEGTIHGVSTKIELKGRYRFDRRTKRVDWLGMLVKEDRQSSLVADGVDVVSRLQITITSAKEPPELTDAALANLTLRSTPELIRLAYPSPDGSWLCRHDRRWHIYHQRPKTSSAVLRLVDGGKAAGQCNLASLPDRDPAKLVSLEEFQKDVRRALGESFGEFVEAGQSTNDAGCRVFRVVTRGTSSEVAMRWTYYLVADPRGRQAAMTFAVEQAMIERFAEADKAMVQSLRFGEQAEQAGRQEHPTATQNMVR